MVVGEIAGVEESERGGEGEEEMEGYKWERGEGAKCVGVG